VSERWKIPITVSPALERDRVILFLKGGIETPHKFINFGAPVQRSHVGPLHRAFTDLIFRRRNLPSRSSCAGFDGGHRNPRPDLSNVRRPEGRYSLYHQDDPPTSNIVTLIGLADPGQSGSFIDRQKEGRLESHPSRPSFFGRSIIQGRRGIASMAMSTAAPSDYFFFDSVT
jgi:hypothetical protein